MAAMTRTHGRTAGRRRSAAGHVPAPAAARAPRDADRPAAPAWPTAVQVWNWTEGAVLFGQSPSPVPFL